MSTPNGNHKSLQEQRSSSLLSKLFRVLIPCVSSNSHPVEFDSDEIEKPIINTDDDHPTQNNNATPPPDPEPTQVPEIPLTLPQNNVLSPPTPQPPTPPTPTPQPQPQLLPLSETEGVTSGAVQPPGSTGDNSPTHQEKPNARDSTVPSNGTGEGDDSEGTSFTEDEDIDGLDDLEDEEEKLIMDGGAGIPIGPVSLSRIFMLLHET
jgi:RNA polymerase II subunit A small phosphatase-like protein